jgi:hypothetical protein
MVAVSLLKSGVGVTEERVGPGTDVVAGGEGTVVGAIVVFTEVAGGSCTRGFSPRSRNIVHVATAVTSTAAIAAAAAFQLRRGAD